MSKGYEVLFSSGVEPSMVEDALSNVLDTFLTIQETDSKLTNPIINRDLIAVAVALKPNYSGPEEDEILTIAKIGEIDYPKPYETFALKAVSRAFEQLSRGHNVDIAPMEKLAWLSGDELYKASSTSVNGLHVGFAGGWAHHSRLLAVSFASSLSESMTLPLTPPEDIQLYDDEESAIRLAWLNEGQDSGDNAPEDALAREHYRYIFDKISPHP